MGVGLGAKDRRAPAENLAGGPQLCVDLQPDGRNHTNFGPAAVTSGAASASNVLKLSMNIRASFAACSSYSAAFFHVLRGFRTSDGTPGTLCGTSRLKNGSTAYFTLSSCPARAALI